MFWANSPPPSPLPPTPSTFFFSFWGICFVQSCQFISVEINRRDEDTRKIENKRREEEEEEAFGHTSLWNVPL